MLLKFAPIMLAFCSLRLPSYYSNNFADKIDASLSTSIYPQPLLSRSWPDRFCARGKEKPEKSDLAQGRPPVHAIP